MGTGHGAKDCWFSGPAGVNNTLIRGHSLGLCSFQEPLEMKFPNTSYSALALMKVRNLQLVEELRALHRANVFRVSW